MINLKLFWKQYSKYFTEQKWSFLFLIILVMLVTIISSVTPIIYGNTIDSISSFDMKKSVLLISISFFLAIIHSIIETIEGRKSAYLALHISNKIKNNLFEKIIRMTVSNLDTFTKGELINRLENSSDSVVLYFINIAKNIILILINTIVPLIFIFRISTKLSIIAIMMMPIMFTLTLLFQKRINKTQIEYVKNTDVYTTHMYNSIENIESLKAFQTENIAILEFKNCLSRIFSIFCKQQNIGFTLKILQDSLVACFNFIVLFLAANYIVAGELTIGSLVSFVIYIEMLFNAVATLMTFSLSYQQNAINIERILEIENTPSEVDISSEVNIINSIYKIDIKNLDFKYQKGRMILKNLNMKISNPGWYTIVGENGCGKSTLFKILEKFYECEKNHILINDFDLNDIKYGYIRNQIAYASKRDCIINGTIKENIKMIDDSLDDTDIINVLKAVNLYDYIKSLELGLETLIGENAIKLSSGQLQKLTLAKIILKKSSVILFDEVTSDLDINSEQEIIQIIKKLSREKIVISIAHRSSFIIPSDKIFYMYNGCFYDSGTHDELIARCPIYRNLFLTLQDYIN